MTTATNVHVITLRKDRSQWRAWVANPQGGGANADGRNRVSALAFALRLVPVDASFTVQVAPSVYHDRGMKAVASGTKRGGCAHGYHAETRGCILDLANEALDALKEGAA